MRRGRSHVFLDLITDFGTMVWSPLSYSRLAWDWLFILDLSLTSFALVPQIAAWCYRAPGKWMLRAWISWAGLTAGGFGAYELASTAGYPFPFWIVGAVSMIFAATLFAPKISGVGFQWSRAGWCRAGLMLVCIYVGCAGFLHGKAVENVNRFIAANHIPTENSAAFPLPPTLTHWSGMIATPEGVLKTTFHLPGGVIDRAQLYASTPTDLTWRKRKNCATFRSIFGSRDFRSGMWNNAATGPWLIFRMSDFLGTIAST